MGLGNANLIGIYTYGLVLPVSVLRTNLTVQPIHLVQHAYLEVGYNGCSDKVEQFQCRHVLETDSIAHVVGETLLNVRGDVHLLGHYKENLCFNLQSWTTGPMLDIHQKPQCVFFNSKMHSHDILAP